MSLLAIRFKKGRDGSVALTCTRRDGSITWQRQEGARASFFVLHDLTHYAVETVLGCRRAFYGLVAEGWEFDDFVDTGARERLPAEALRVETLVGLLDMERSDGVARTAAELGEQAALHYESKGVSGEPPRPTEEQLHRIRERRQELFAQWAGISPAESMELAF